MSASDSRRDRPQPRGSSRESRATVWIVSFIALAAVTVAAIIVILSTRNINIQTKVLWSLPAPSGSASPETRELAGLWLTDDVIVRATVLGLTGYELDTGKQQWRLPMLKGTSLCQVSPNVVDGIVAVIFGASQGSGDKCDQLTAVVVTTGERRWTTSLKQPGDTSSQVRDRLASVSVARGLVVAQDVDAIRGYATGDGGRRWSLDPPSSSKGRCLPFRSMVDGDRMIAVLDCQGQGHVSMIDTATGRALWQRNTTPAEGDVRFMDPISVTPVVLASKGAGTQRQMLVLDSNSGALVRQISTSVGATSELNFTSDAIGLGGRAYYPVVINVGKLFATTEGAVGERRNEIVAVDLSTGRVTWRTPSAAGTVETMLTADGDGVFTLNMGSLKRLPRLVRYDGATGKATDGVTLPKTAINTQFPVRFFIQDNKIVIASLSAGNAQPLITVLGKKPHWWSGE